ncbi:MAG TPA: hypothetical protein VGK62_08200 [Gaiellaceae bacterium]
MTVLAFTIKAHTGVRLAELGAALGAVGSLALLLGALMPLARRAGQALGGLLIGGGYVLLVIAIRWGHFH